MRARHRHDLNMFDLGTRDLPSLGYEQYNVRLPQLGWSPVCVVTSINAVYCSLAALKRLGDELSQRE